MSEICGSCLKYNKDLDYPPRFMGTCTYKNRLVAYYTISECGVWEPKNAS
jgi:hypothetical protein